MTYPYPPREEAVLVLEDGTFYRGYSVGASGKVMGSIVFTTAMTGYQELMTDPATKGQIVVFTYPLIGNYGMNDEDGQSEKPQLEGLVAWEIARHPSNYRAKESLPQFLQRHQVVGIDGIDTRALVQKLKTVGVVQALIATGNDDPRLLHQELMASKTTISDSLHKVTTSQPYLLADQSGPHVSLIDLGVRKSTLDVFMRMGFRVMVYPADAKPEEIVSLKPEAVVFAGGPGSVHQWGRAVKTAEALLGDYAVLGVGLGHLVVGLALGAGVDTIPYGHRGSSIPVKDVETGRVYQTFQHHHETIVPKGDDGLIVSYVNVNDGTVEGLRHREFPVWTFQFYPEAGPGPDDTGALYEKAWQHLFGETKG